ncbi:MAG: hypothetical protein ACI4C3_03200 [Bacteroides sp.]
MKELKAKRTYEAPQVEVIEVEPMQVMAGSVNTSTSVNDWGDGGSLGTASLLEEWDLEGIE